jgi:catechol-2,3-dioxygenase
MPITRLNHAVLFVRDVSRSVAFYSEALGFRRVGGAADTAFMQAPGSSNDHDLGLFEIGSGAGESLAGTGTVGLYHLAWEVDTLDELERLAGELERRGALVGSSDHGTTKSLYGKDPDGIEFEIAWLIPAALLDDQARSGKMATQKLDLAAAKARYGGDTRGGVGVSTPA